MKQLFSIQDKDFLLPVDKKEDVLRDFLWDNRVKLFQKFNFVFVAKEYSLNEGQVHDSGKMGRIDILAYNTASERFVIFELKKDDGKGRALYQARKYRQYIKKHFPAVCWDVREKYNVPIRKSANDKAEIILIAKEFTEPVIDEADEEESLITLIKYKWFGDDFLFLEYVHCATDIKDKTSKPPKMVNPKSVNYYVKKGWKYTVGSIKDSSIKEQLQNIAPVVPTKENANELRTIIDRVGNLDKRAALLKLLDEIETQD